MICPQCHQAEMTFDWHIGTMRCPACEHLLYSDLVNASKTQDAHEAHYSHLAGKPPVSFEPPPGLDMDDFPEYLSEYDQVRLRGRLSSAMWALARGNEREIERSLRAVLEISEDHADTWLHLAARARDAAEQRQCLEHVLACKPGHPLAIRLVAMLDGKLDPAPLPATGGQLAPDQVAVQRLACPQCGGSLTYQPATRAVVCNFCGYEIVDADDLQRTDTSETLIAGNLRRKFQARHWNVGKRWVRCESCGAISTLSRDTLSRTCRYCHSQQVVVESVNHRFEQPDLIVPFRLSEADARAAIDTYLKSGIRRFTRFFADAIARIDLQNSYLPFWIFDADMVVNWSWTRATAHGKHPVLLNEVPYLAVPAPDAWLAQKIEPWNLRAGVDYDPRLLAAIPARLYSIDLPEASISVRQRLTRDACREAEPSLRLQRPRGANSDDDPGSLRLNAYTQFLTYRLALLPVWLGQLVEEDGDTRQIMVNGQTGKVAQGKLRKAAR
ncbi:MAG: hypothetical protein Kow0077_02040 [Anaerolineae bacterium]